VAGKSYIQSALQIYQYMTILLFKLKMLFLMKILPIVLTNLKHAFEDIILCVFLHSCASIPWRTQYKMVHFIYLRKSGLFQIFIENNIHSYVEHTVNVWCIGSVRVVRVKILGTIDSSLKLFTNVFRSFLICIFTWKIKKKNLYTYVSRILYYYFIIYIGKGN